MSFNSIKKDDKILEAYEKILNEMKMTFLDAIKILAKTGNEDKAWNMAKKDEGLKKGTTKEEWLNFAYNSEAYKKLAYKKLKK